MTWSGQMPKNNFEVKLSVDEIAVLKAMTHKGYGASAKKIMHANILLKTDDSLGEKRKTNREIAEYFDISPTTVNQVRKTYATEGLDAALNRRTRITPPHISKKWLCT